ncbi:hypothetical protein BER2_0182 [plant metagenome]|uniref:Uncharacterized protein n=1 Tax=plant metagenome TaxID=1297885 RepID=A0A484QXX3_9ZZZZ
MKCPRCKTLNDSDRYEEAFTNSPTGTFHYRCMNQRCSHMYSSIVDKLADARARSEVMARATHELQKKVIETDC